MADSAVLEIIAPGLFTAGPAGSGIVDTAALQRLLTRADCGAAPGDGPYRTIFSRFGGTLTEDTDPPLAPLAMMAEGLEPGPHYWLRAQPVQLHADRDSLMLFPVESSMGEAPSAAMLEAFNRHFADRGWQLTPSARRHWYLKAPAPLQVATSPPAQVAGRSVEGHLPRGRDAFELTRLTAESEMLFHALTDGEGPVGWNSLWLWGGGRLPERLGPVPGRVWTADAAVQGMALLAGGVPVEAPMPDSGGIEPGIVFCRDLEIALMEDDANAFDTGLTELNELIESAVAALRRGRLSELRIGDGSAGLCRFRAYMSWRWWRRSRQLSLFSGSA